MTKKGAYGEAVATQTEVAKILGTTRQGVRLIERSILRKFRQALEDRNITLQDLLPMQEGQCEEDFLEPLG